MSTPSLESVNNGDEMKVVDLIKRLFNSTLDQNMHLNLLVSTLG